MKILLQLIIKKNAALVRCCKSLAREMKVPSVLQNEDIAWVNGNAVWVNGTEVWVDEYRAGANGKVALVNGKIDRLMELLL